MKIEDIIIWILVVICIIVGAWYLFGGSPTFEQAILVFILTAVFGIGISVGKIGVRLKFIEKKFNNIENSFTRLASDFKEHIKHK